MHRKLLLSLAVLLPVVALTTVGTLALFTDQEAIGANLFDTGKIDLSLGTASAVVTFPSGMMPGDSAGPNALTVSNAAGSSSLRYAVSVATSTTDSPSKNLDQVLTLVVKTMDTDTAGCANFNGTQLFSGDLAASATSGEVIGSAATGDDSGDRALAVNGSEILCFQVTLPTSATNAVASADATATFTFDAEQTANN
jgi:predicted ribosomally synthesized peptide with SipW-like signal peptide